MRVAILDLGSSSFHALIADILDDGDLVPIRRERELLHLGATVARTGAVPAAVLAEARAAVERLRAAADEAGAEVVVALATSAVRDAANRDDLVECFRQAARTDVCLLDGEEEARLALRGQRAGVSVGAGPFLGLDLGGGSLEIALANELGLCWLTSVDLGGARLAGELVTHDPMTRRERRALQARVAELLRPVRRDLVTVWTPVAVVSGGTARALARVAGARRWRTAPPSLNQFRIAIGELCDLDRRLGSLTLAERVQLPGMQARRAEHLPIGTAILTMTALELGFEAIVISEWGLREGALLEATDAARPGRDLRSGSIARLAERSRIDRTHARSVSALADQLFVATQDLHGLGGRERELLRHGAWLHDVGAPLGAGHHKRGAEVVLGAALRGFAPDEIDVLATLVRFHKGSRPAPTFEPFERLDRWQRTVTAWLLALLRVADGLDTEHRGTVERVTAHLDAGSLRLRIGGSGDLREAAGRAETKSVWLAELSGRAVHLELPAPVAVP